MNYKELIEKLRKYMCLAPGGRTVHSPILDVAADVIETLLAERDAAMKHIPKTCYTCRWWHDGGCCAPLNLYGGGVILKFGKRGNGLARRRGNPMENKPEPRVCGAYRNYDALSDACREGGSVRENRGDCGKREKEK